MQWDSIARQSWPITIIIAAIFLLTGCGTDSDNNPSPDASNSPDTHDIADTTDTSVPTDSTDRLADRQDDADRRGASNTSKTPPSSDASINSDNSECPILEKDDIIRGVTLEEGTCYTIDKVLDLDTGLLQIKPGVRLIFAESAGIRITWMGRLQALGSASDPIIFTGSEKTRGFWRGLEFLESPYDLEDNILEHVIIEYAGSSRSRTIAGLTVSGRQPQLTVRNSTLRENNTYDLRAEGLGTYLVLDNIRYENNNIPLSISPDMVGCLNANQAFIDNDLQYIHLQEFPQSVQREQIWHAFDIPYRFSLTTEAVQPLTIEAGAVLEFPRTHGFIVNGAGRLIADADGKEPIVFKSIEDDFHTSWAGLVFQTHSLDDNILANVVVRDAGTRYWTGRRESQANILLLGDSILTIRNSEITDSGHYGISLLHNSVLKDCRGLVFKDNANEDMRAGDEASMCDAP